MLALFLIALSVVCQTTSIIAVEQIPLTIVNLAGKPVELYWVDTSSRDGHRVKMTTNPLKNNSETEFLSYYEHEFVAKVLDHHSPVSEARFTKGPDYERLYITIDPETNVVETSNVLVDQQMPLTDKIKQLSVECASFAGKQLSNCIANGIYKDVSEISQKKVQMEKYRDVIASRLRNYTCADADMVTSAPIDAHSVHIQGNEYTVQSMFNMSRAQIYFVEDFVTDEECDVLMKHGGPRLRRATVAAEDGTSVVSENRKAQQASYDIHHTKHAQSDDPLWPLFNRILNMTNIHTGLNLEPYGQEHYTIIQYDPNGSDQYTPHCDGACNGEPHISTGRVATTVLYCKAPIRGGATTFTKANVFVKPKKNAAAFFSYYGSDGIMDDGYTEHSGCPVLEGEKWITALWMRKGVSAENPWDFYDPMGIPIMTGNDEERGELEDEE